MTISHHQHHLRAQFVFRRRRSFFVSDLHFAVAAHAAHLLRNIGTFDDWQLNCSATIWGEHSRWKLETKTYFIIPWYFPKNLITNSVNVVTCSSRLAHRVSSSCSRAFVAELLSVPRCTEGLTELIELDIDCDGYDVSCGAAVEEEDVVVVVDAKLLLSILADMFDSNSLGSSSSESNFIDEYVVRYASADNAGLHSFIFWGASGWMYSVSIDVAFWSPQLGGGSVRFIIRWYDESLQIAWILSIRCFSFTSYFRHALDSEMVGDFMELLLWLETDSISSSSNEMICFLFEPVVLVSAEVFMSFFAPTTGTAMIISFGFCKHFVSAGEMIFNSGLSTVTANRIVPKPFGTSS